MSNSTCPYCGGTLICDETRSEITCDTCAAMWKDGLLVNDPDECEQE